MNYKVIQKGQEDSFYMKNFENIVMTKQIWKSIILKQLVIIDLG